MNEQQDISALRIDLGPQWNEIELEVFLKIFRQQQLTGIDRMQETLRQLGYQRSKINLLSVYKKNKNFLESNQNCTPHDLYLILRDHYEQSDHYNYEIPPGKRIKLSQGEIIYQDRKWAPQKFNLILIQEESQNYFKQTKCINGQCQFKNEFVSSNFCKWMQHEYFYSHLDYTYFSLNEFQQMLQKAEILIDEKSIQDWRQIKMAIGKPRRFSSTFLKQEQSKLSKYRSVIRNFLFDQNYPIHKDIRNLDLIHDIVRLAPYCVGQTVYAIHPICNHVHIGTIIQTNLPTITIKFNQSELGMHKISDQNICLEDKFISQQMSDDRFDMQQQLSYNAQNETKSTLIQSIVSDLDHYATAFMIRILQRKYALVGHLKKLSTKLEEDPTLNNDEEFKQLYQWSINQIKNFDQASKHVMTRFRMRGLNGYSLNQVNSNLDKVLSMPLAYMEREIEQNNVKPEEEKKNQEIKQILHKQQNERINSQLKSFLNVKFDKETPSELRQLVSSLFGLLFTLNQNQDLNMNSNQYWQTLQSQIEQTHPQQFQEIQESVLRIVGNQNK